MYRRLVMKRRPASLTEEEWLVLLSLRDVDRGYFRDRDGRGAPPVDVYDLVYGAKLDDLKRRLEVLCVAMLKPSTSTSSNGQSSLPASPGQLLAAFSELWEFLVAPAYSDGSKRVGGTISLKSHSGGLQVTLTDLSSATYCCQTAPTLDDAFLALEIGLKEGTLSWRPSGYAKSRK